MRSFLSSSIRFGPRSALLLACLTATTSLALAQNAPVTTGPYPFEGRWDCDIAIFQFSDTVFSNGSDDMPITDIAAHGPGYVLSFEDDYQLSVAINPDGTLQWFSPASGDAFTCHKLG